MEFLKERQKESIQHFSSSNEDDELDQCDNCDNLKNKVCNL